MTLDWLPRDDELKDHNLFGEEHWGTTPPCTMYERRPLVDSEGNAAPDLHTAWITLNNPKQYNSYTTNMVKGVIAGFTAVLGGLSWHRSLEACRQPATPPLVDADDAVDDDTDSDDRHPPSGLYGGGIEHPVHRG